MCFPALFGFFSIVPTSTSSACHKHHDQQLSFVTSVNKGPNTTRLPTQDLLAELRAVTVVSASHSKQGLPERLSPCLSAVHLPALWKVSYLSAANPEWHSTRAAPEQNFSPRGPGTVEQTLAAKEAVVFRHWYKDFSWKHCKSCKRQEFGWSRRVFGGLIVHTVQMLSEDCLRHSCNWIYTMS